MNLWLDANAILRFLVNDHEEHARRVEGLLERAERGEVQLVVTALVIAECTWVLKSFYKRDRVEIAEGLLRFLAADGLTLPEEDAVLEGLRLMLTRSVDFADAYLAACAKGRGEAVASFDLDYRKLGCEVMAP